MSPIPDPDATPIPDGGTPGFSGDPAAAPSVTPRRDGRRASSGAQVRATGSKRWPITQTNAQVRAYTVGRSLQVSSLTDVWQLGRQR
jgi:hypothetical protein